MIGIFGPARSGGPAGIYEGARVNLEIGKAGLATRMEVLHRDFEDGRSFVDEQASGPFKKFIHRHGFSSDGSGGAVIEDRAEWELPFSADRLGPARRFVERNFRRMFRFREERISRDLARHLAVSDRPRLRVAIGGSGGLLGTALATFLQTGGHEVVRLVRRKPRHEVGEVFWDPARGELDASALGGVDVVVNLSGEGLTTGRWTESRKRAIVDSRVRSSRLLAETVAGMDDPPKAMLSASAVGYYGHCESAVVCEEDREAGSGFLAELCGSWEDATAPAAKAGVRVVSLRIGVALSARGGALHEMLLPFRLGLGGPAGSGGQYISWVSMDDVVYAMYDLMFADGISGPVNVSSPNPAPNAEFAEVLSRVLGRPSALRAPAFLIRLVYGEMGEALLLEGSRIEPSVLKSMGYEFASPDLEDTIRGELGIWSDG